MKFSFKILNHDTEREMLHVQYTPADKDLGVIKLRLAVLQDESGNWPARDAILLMIRRSVPIERWQRRARAREQTAETLQPIIDLIGYEEAGVSKPPESQKEAPQYFPVEGVV